MGGGDFGERLKAINLFKKAREWFQVPTSMVQHVRLFEKVDCPKHAGDAGGGDPHTGDAGDHTQPGKPISDSKFSKKRVFGLCF